MLGMTTAAALDDPETSRDDRASVDKAICLLTAFGSQAATGVGVSELARRACLSKSTAFRVLGMLERNGVVERVGRGYRLGGRLAELGRTVYAPEHDRLRDQLTPFVSDLYEATHETVHLVALHGPDVVYLAKLFGHRQVKAPSRVGGRVPAHATAGGKAMLAYDSDALEQTVANGLVPLTAATITDPDVLTRQLDSVRATGIAAEFEEVTSGLACVGAPIFGPGGVPVAAISVSAPPARLQRRQFEAAIRQVACEATRHLSRRRLAAAVAISA